MEIINGDILKVKEGLVIHGTNCSGGFGSGIAGQVRQQLPIVYEHFLKMPKGEDTLGKLQIVPVSENLYWGNGFSQLNFGKDGKRYASLDAIDKILNRAFSFCMLYNYILNAPKIGCGLGGLRWDDEVKPIFEKYEQLYPEVTVRIFEFDK
jgi:hypothetical protein